MALVKIKSDPRAELLEAVQVEPTPVNADEPNGAQYKYGLVTGRTEATEASGKGKNRIEATLANEPIIGDLFTESEFYRLYSPFDNQDAKELKQV
jgi:hypothetical protein